jgi:polar amino acid transport system substrate-binding protein
MRSWWRLFAVTLGLWAALLPLKTASADPPAAGFRFPERLVVGTKVTPPFSMKSPDGAWTGISFDLWHAIEADLGFTSTIVAEPKLQDLFQGVSSGSLDVAIAAVTVTAGREDSLDFSQPYFTTGLGIAVPERHGGFLSVASGLFSWSFLRIVGLLVLLLFAMGFLAWLFERRRNPEQFGGTARSGLASGFWWAAVTMTTVGYGDKAPATVGGRIVGFIWMFMAIIVISSFTAAIASSLTVSHLETPIHGPEDLAHVSVGTVPGTTSARYLERHHIVFHEFPTVEDALTALAGGEVGAVVYDVPLLKYLSRRDWPGRISVLPGTFERQAYAIVLPQGSPLREPLNRALLREIQGSGWEDTVASYLGR